MAEQRRTYRLTSARATKLIFNLSRLGERIDSVEQRVTLFRGPARDVEVRVENGRQLLGLVDGEARGTVAVFYGQPDELLEGAGLPRVASYANQSERYRIGDTGVEVDHIESLGWFCVLAADAAEGLDAAAAQLSLEVGEIEPRTYSELLGVARVARPGVPPVARRASGARRWRLALIAIVGLVLAVLVDLRIAAAVVLLLLLLEWGFGASGRPTAPPEAPAEAPPNAWGGPAR